MRVLALRRGTNSRRHVGRAADVEPSNQRHVVLLRMVIERAPTFTRRPNGGHEERPGLPQREPSLSLETSPWADAVAAVAGARRTWSALHDGATSTRRTRTERALADRPFPRLRVAVTRRCDDRRVRRCGRGPRALQSRPGSPTSSMTCPSRRPTPRYKLVTSACTSAAPPQSPRRTNAVDADTVSPRGRHTIAFGHPRGPQTAAATRSAPRPRPATPTGAGPSPSDRALR